LLIRTLGANTFEQRGGGFVGRDLRYQFSRECVVECTSPKRSALIECLKEFTLHERHFLIQLSAWLLLDLEPRLRHAWLNKAVRYNNLLKDFYRVPGFYAEVVEGFSDLRRK
jgi:hypothetical protein